MELAKILHDGTIDVRFCTSKMGSKITELRNAGFLDFVRSKQPQCEAGYKAVDSFVVDGGKVIQSWVIQVDADAVNKQICELKNQLTATDYKVAKCWEYSLVDETLPYDIATLHSERQALRNEINRLESSLQL